MMPEHRLLYMPARYPRLFKALTQPSLNDRIALEHAALRAPLRNQKQLPKDVRARVLSGLQAGGTTGITGRVQFDQFGDATEPTFTLYQVQGTPLAWTPVSSP